MTEHLVDEPEVAARPASDRIREIVADLRLIVADEVQLLRGRVEPAATQAGIGGGLVLAAGVLALTTLPLAALIGSGLFAWLYSRWLSPYPAVVLGLTTVLVLLLLVAAVLVLVALPRLKQARRIKPAIDDFTQHLAGTADLAKGAVETGLRKVDGLTGGDRAEIPSA